MIDQLLFVGFGVALCTVFGVAAWIVRRRGSSDG